MCRMGGPPADDRVVRALKPNALDREHLVCEETDPVLEVEQVIYLEDGTAQASGRVRTILQPGSSQ